MSFKTSEGAQWSEPQSSGAAVAVRPAYFAEGDGGVWGVVTSLSEAEGALGLSGSVYGIDNATTTHAAGLYVRTRGSTDLLIYTVS